jgi:16S rRNA (cytidine1402-2'-O)-methyltransferase
MELPKQDQIISSQVLPAGLWIVATPIGNLGDVSSRAKRALEVADHVLCEDTRRTAALLSSLGQDRFLPKLQRLDAHTETAQLEKWIEDLQEGLSLALVTDAGTPSVSDPGAALVHLAHQAGIKVVPIPGPSAVTALISASGFQATAFAFRGFFPRKNTEQKQELARLMDSKLSRVCVWFESPHRIVDTLQTLEEFVTSNQRDAEVIVGKELTKLYERIFWGSPHEILENVTSEIRTQGEKGEWCFGVWLKDHADQNFDSKSIESLERSVAWKKALKCLIEAGISPSSAAKRVSQEFGETKKTVYDAALILAGKKTEEGG